MRGNQHDCVRRREWHSAADVFLEPGRDEEQVEHDDRDAPTVSGEHDCVRAEVVPPAARRLAVRPSRIAGNVNARGQVDPAVGDADHERPLGVRHLRVPDGARVLTLQRHDRQHAESQREERQTCFSRPPC